MTMKQAGLFQFMLIIAKQLNPMVYRNSLQAIFLSSLKFIVAI